MRYTNGRRILLGILILIAALCVSCVASAASSGSCGDNATWTLDDSGLLTISGSGDMYDYFDSGQNYAPWHNKTIKTINIENGISGIGDYAFEGCSDLTSISISNSVTYIGNSSFRNCTSLTSVTIPRSVEFFAGSFVNCTRLTTVTVLGNTYEISFAQNFFGCTSLINIIIPSDHNSFYSENGVVYNKNRNTLIYYPEGKSAASFSIPNGVNCIGEYAFRCNNHLTSVIIPDSVITIEDYAFTGCQELTGINIPNSVTSIGRSVFDCCYALTNITLPNTITAIDEFTFYVCHSLTEIIIPNTVTSIGFYAFKDCSKLSTVTIPDSVTSIAGQAFEGCALREVTLSDNVTSIAEDAFDKTVVINATAGSYAAQWASQNGYILNGKYVAITIDGNGTASADPVSGLEGTVVTLTAEPDYDYQFVGWEVLSGDITIQNNKFTIGTENVKIRAVFKKIHAISVTCEEGGTVSASPVAGIEGTEVTLSATPYSGYRFKEWEVVSGGVTIQDNKFTIGIEDVNIRAVFEREYSITITATAGGTASSVPACGVEGAEITLTATPSSGYSFKEWQVLAGDITIENNKFTIGTTDISICAIFEKIYTITVSNDGNGTASADPASGVNGTEVNLTAIPSAGYQFKEWKVVSGGVSIQNNQFTIGKADVSIRAIFEKIYTISLTDDGNGTASSDSSSGVHGTEITLTAIPATGYQFKEWEVVSGGIVIENNKFNIGTADVTIHAIFEKIYSVTVTSNGNGTAAADFYSGITGTEVSLTAEPDPGYLFKEWEVISGSVTIENGKFQIGSADVEIMAIFQTVEEGTYTVTVNNDGNGKGIADPVSGLEGTEVTLTATPNEGYIFKEWQVISGGITIENNKFQIGTAHVVIKAIFEIDMTAVHTVSVLNDGNGTATANPVSGVYGTEVVLSATPNSGYQFKEWQVVAGNVTVTNNRFKFGTTNVDIKAIFEKLPDPEPVIYTVTVITDRNGTAYASPISGPSGTEVTLTATPNTGYRFKEWYVIAGDISIANNKFTIGTLNVQILAYFEPEPEPELEPEPEQQPEPEPEPEPQPEMKTETTVSGGKYQLDNANKTAVFTGPAKKNNKKLTIPATIQENGETYRVTEIAANACKKNKKLKQVTIGANIEKIGKDAFNGCSSLTKVTIKTTKLTKAGIGKNCFKGTGDGVTYKCPKKMKKNYKTWLTKNGKASKKATYK